MFNVESLVLAAQVGMLAVSAPESDKQSYKNNAG